MKTQATTAAQRYEVESFISTDGTIQIIDTDTDLVYTMDATEDDVKFFANGNQEYGYQTIGWNWKHEEPEEVRVHYTEIELEPSDVFAYVISNQEKWGEGKPYDMI